ncbi:MAG: two-component system repressor protein LuxO [Candidatus Pelagisphaera sp.]|jgi:two-component system repressor protein LuxO
MKSILLVEDSPSQARLHFAYLQPLGVDVVIAETGADAREAMTAQRFDLMLLDLRLPDIHGLELLKDRSLDSPPTIVLTGEGSLRLAIEAMQAGAMDFQIKPVSADKLRESVERALEGFESVPAEHLIDELESPQTGPARAGGKPGPNGFFGESPVMRNVFSLIEAAAPSTASVFVTGESGTGKELCARAIHNAGPRRNGSFIALNCAAIPRELIESEIFGHRKGAFTGAIENREGAASMADGGTLFLDEICELELNLQGKLLRFIQTGSYRRVGDSNDRDTDIRFVCATNRDPMEEVKAKRFREDLYYRLYVIPIDMPPLRARGSDIGLLADRFLRDFAKIEGKSFKSFSPEAIACIQSYTWPGNVRELENVIRMTVVLNDGEEVGLATLPTQFRTETAGTLINKTPGVENGPTTDNTKFFLRSLEEIEMIAITKVIDHFDGNITEAARTLDISTSTIYRKRQNWIDKGLMEDSETG